LKMSGFFDKLALVCGNARATAEGSPTGFMAMTLQVLMVVYAWLRYVNDVTMSGQGKQFLIYKVGAAVLVPHVVGWFMSYGKRNDDYVQKVGYMTSAAITVYFVYTTELGLAYFRELLVVFFFLVHNYLGFWSVDARIEAVGSNEKYAFTKEFWSAYLFSWVVQAAGVVLTGLPIWLLIVDGKRTPEPEFTQNEQYALGAAALGLLLRWFSDGSETHFLEKVKQSDKAFVDADPCGPNWDMQSFIWKLSRSAVELSDFIFWGSIYFFAEAGYENAATRHIVVATWGAGALWTLFSSVAWRSKQLDMVWANQKTYQEYRAATPQLIHEYLLVALAAAGVGVVYMQ